MNAPFLFSIQYLKKLETFSEFVTNSKISFYPIFSGNLISSATLSGNYIRNWHIRNFETNSHTNNKRICALLEHKHLIWLCESFQGAKTNKLNKRINEIDLEMAIIARVNDHLKDMKLQGQLKIASSKKYRYKTIANLIYNHYTSNIHPTNVIKNNTNILNEDLHIRGVAIRLAGPRLGNRSVVYRKMIGKSTNNSVGIVNWDGCSVQIPGKLGTYGLKIKVIYNLIKSLPHKKIRIDNGVSSLSPFEV